MAASWYKQQRKRVRQARQRVKQQYTQLLEMELEGMVAVELRTCSQHLTLPLASDTATQLADLLREALRTRLTQLRAEAQQLQQDEQESREQSAQDRALLQTVKSTLS